MHKFRTWPRKLKDFSRVGVHVAMAKVEVETPNGKITINAYQHNNHYDLNQMVELIDVDSPVQLPNEVYKYLFFHTLKDAAESALLKMTVVEEIISQASKSENPKA